MQQEVAVHREFEFNEGKSHKFWRIELHGDSHTVQFGRVGTAGQTKTKSFGSQQQAQQSYDKLIAEKLAKGYHEIPGQDVPAVAATIEPLTAGQAEPEIPPSMRHDAPSTDSRPAEEIVVEVRRQLLLDPLDELWATWKPRTVRLRPEPKPFDREDCLKRLSKVRVTDGGWTWHWETANLAESMTPEEARFWFEAMTSIVPNVRPKQHSQELQDIDVSEPLTPYEVEERLRSRPGARALGPHWILAVSQFLSLEELVACLLDESLITTGFIAGYVATQLPLHAAEGFRRFVLPYLSDEQVAEIREWVGSGLSPDDWPRRWHLPPAMEFQLAGFVGHPRLLDVVSSWPDDLYSAQLENDWCHRPQQLVFGLPSPELVNYHCRRLNLRLSTSNYIRAWLATTEFAGLDYVAESIQRETERTRADEVATTFCNTVVAPEAAEPMMSLVVNSKAPAPARTWLDRYVGCGIAGLVSTAASRGRLAEAAVDYLREKKRLGYANIIAEHAASLPTDAADKVRRAVLDHSEPVYETLEEHSTPSWLRHALLAETGSAGKRSKLPDWLAIGSLPALLIDGRRLNEAHVTQVLQTLQKSTLNAPSPLLKELRAHADPFSLEAFAWRLFERWQEHGCPSKDKWCLGAIGLLGGDASVLKLTPLLRAWPGESQHARAVFGLECLRAVGSDTALMQLNGIAQKLKFKGLKEKARLFMQQIAEEQGLTPAQLADRIVPDCGLDEHGARTFDFGPRQFQFVFGSDLKPMLRDDSGKLRADLPKPGARDDATLANQSVADWKLLKQQLREAVKTQIPRLEQAMVVGRRWTVAEFEMLLARHPLMTHLVRNLLWGGYDSGGQLAGTFRLTAELDYADANDSVCTLANYSSVGIVHPADLSGKDRQRWAEIFGDYEIVPPFEQLSRRVYTLEPGQEQQHSLDQFDHCELNPLTMLGILERLDWMRGQPQDGGVFYQHFKPFPQANITAVLEYEPGIPVGYPDGWEQQSINGCFVLPGILTGGWHWNLRQQALRLADVGPVVISEVLRDLHVLAAKATR